MKLKIISTTVALTLCQLLSAAQADPVVAGTSEPSEATKAVPRLNIAWNCGGCTQNDKVIPLIEQAYSNEAAKNGKVISETETAEVAIVSYRQRNPGARVMLGIMAGKDTLGLKITYNGSELSVSDYSANAMQGMNYLCESVAKQAFKKISGAFK